MQQITLRNTVLRGGDAVIIVITGVKELSEKKQHELGQSILVGMYHAGVAVEGVKVDFEGKDS